MRAWPALACRRDVVRCSLRVALPAGTIRVAINHGDRLVSGTPAPADRVKTALTCPVSCGVSPWASASAIGGSSGHSNGDF